MSSVEARLARYREGSAPGPSRAWVQSTRLAGSLGVSNVAIQTTLPP